MTQSDAYDIAAAYRAALSARPMDPATIAALRARAGAYEPPLAYLATHHRYDRPTIAATFHAPALADPLRLLRLAAKATGATLARRIPTHHAGAASTSAGRLTITHPWEAPPADPLTIDDIQAHALAHAYRESLTHAKRTGTPDPDAPQQLADLRAVPRLLAYSVRWHPRNAQPTAPATIHAPPSATLSQLIQRAKAAAGITGHPLRAPYQSAQHITADSARGTLQLTPAPRPQADLLDAEI